MKTPSTLAAVALLGLAAIPSARALEVSAGDYEVYPAGVNIGIAYFQHAQRSDFYVHGTKALSNFGLVSDVGLARYIHPTALTASITLDPQFILPFGSLTTNGNAAALGNASGVGDLILGMPVKFLLDERSRDAFSIAPFVYVPVGTYDHDKGPVNLGENRWKGLLQLAYVKHFGPSWALDTVADVQVTGANDRYGTTNATLKEAPRYETQAHLRYNLSPATALSAGYGLYWGARQRIDGVDQDNRLRTQYARVGITSFVAPTVQLQALVGRDLKVENGFEQKAFLNLRVAKIF